MNTENSVVGVILLITAILLSGAYSIFLKPANDFCRTLSGAGSGGERTKEEKRRTLAGLELFNGCFTVIAMLGAGITATVRTSLYLPFRGVLMAALFGVVFSVTVFTNLKALEDGPLSLTTLLVNFSLVLPLIYSFCYLGEKITVLRIVGILLLVFCMFLFTNPKVTGGERLSWKWFGISFLSMFCNGTLSNISKTYALDTDNAYSSAYLAYCYLFATVTSLLIFCFLNMGLKKEDRISGGEFFKPAMLGNILTVGVANFGLNLCILLLATRMDGAIVYPAVLGGAPVIVCTVSRFVFGEQISAKKWAAIALSILAIVILNL